MTFASNSVVSWTGMTPSGPLSELTIWSTAMLGHDVLYCVWFNLIVFCRCIPCFQSIVGEGVRSWFGVLCLSIPGAFLSRRPVPPLPTRRACLPLRCTLRRASPIQQYDHHDRLLSCGLVSLSGFVYYRFELVFGFWRSLQTITTSFRTKYIKLIEFAGEPSAMNQMDSSSTLYVCVFCGIQLIYKQVLTLSSPALNGMATTSSCGC